MKIKFIEKIQNFIQDKLKNSLPALAEAAANYAEISLSGTGRGQEKKEMAINYVMRYLPLPVSIRFLEPLIRTALNGVIDLAIEQAVEKLNAYKNKTKNLL